MQELFDELRSRALCNRCWRNIHMQSANLRGFDLRGADLRYATLVCANLREADLSGANLRGANLFNANLRGANLTGADLRGSNLRRADLDGAHMPEGVTWEEYISETVPALLTAGGKTLREIVESGAWGNYDWQGCPLSVAYGATCLEDIPVEHQHAAADFVHRFSCGLIPCPLIGG